MVNSVAAGQYSPYYHYNSALSGAQASRPSVSRAIPAAQPGVPVQPVSPAPAAVPVQSGPINTAHLLDRYENDPAAMAVRGRMEQVDPAKSPQEVLEEGECKTCAERKYQDGSDDPGVSFKTAGHIDPDQAASVVRGHEQEHVIREQAKASREDRKVVSQSVTLHNDICPECGRSYVSGGTTRTVTKSIPDPVQRQQAAAQESPETFSAVA